MSIVCCDRTPHRHGKDRQGFQRYKCPICGKTYSDNPNPGKPGRRLIEDHKLSGAERQRRHREQKKAKQNERGNSD